jgi:hypothetical protein
VEAFSADDGNAFSARVDNEEQLLAAVEAAKAHPGLALIECTIDKVRHHHHHHHDHHHRCHDHHHHYHHHHHHCYHMTIITTIFVILIFLLLTFSLHGRPRKRPLTEVSLRLLFVWQDDCSKELLEWGSRVATANGRAYVEL